MASGHASGRDVISRDESAGSVESRYSCGTVAPERATVERALPARWQKLARAS